jgi:predicted nucleic acid-binding Zn ribbon protein
VSERRAGRRADEEPRPLRDSLAEVSADLGLPEPDALAFLIREWENLVGPEVAPHCRLTSLRDGVLRVTVDSAPRGTQLRYREAELVERAKAMLGPDVVCELRVRVGAPAARRGR